MPISFFSLLMKIPKIPKNDSTVNLNSTGSRFYENVPWWCLYMSVVLSVVMSETEVEEDSLKILQIFQSRISSFQIEEVQILKL